MTGSAFLSDGAPSGPNTIGPASSLHRALLALDPGPPDARVGVVVKEFLERWPLSLEVAHVVFTSTGQAADESDGSPADDREVRQAHALRSTLVEWWGTRGQAVPIHILHGDPGERICEYADYSGCDLIILAGRTREGIAARLKGSVRKFVAGRTRRSLLIIGE